MVFKCKICGGNLNIKSDTQIVECEYCGTKQTLPVVKNQKIVNLYDRANHFRINNEYDKAEAIYEMILNENIKDAECYWSIVLCQFGVEYVEDTNTHEYIPTCNRTQNTPVFANENYKQAIKYATNSQKEIYEKEAKKIDEIQKGIIEISRKELPYDVFICYKETDENGDRTEDSVIAQEIYDKLKNEGIRTFFARITLEDKIGRNYEPYIYSALNSAKVMLVIGTKKDHFEAVWVKNEWSRFLTLTKNNKDKVLIPCFKGMDAYGLPEEFLYLQSQDMGKIGYMQDLIHGIKKIIEVEPISKQKVKKDLSDEEKNEMYNLAKKNMNLTIDTKALKHIEKKTIYNRLRKDFDKLGNFLDSRELSIKCNELYKNEKNRILKNSIKVIIPLIVIICIAGALVTKIYIIPTSKYNMSMQKLENKEYYEAIEGFSQLSDYKDCNNLIEELKNKWRKQSLNTICTVKSSSGDFVYGVKEIGTVYNLSSVFNSYKNIVQIESLNNEQIILLRKDGTVIYDNENNTDKEFWNDIIAIKTLGSYLFGLRKNGTVIQKKMLEDYDDIEYDVSNWKDIIQIETYERGIVGLKSDGTLICDGFINSTKIYFKEWKDIVKLSGIRTGLVGLKKDGTLICTGEVVNSEIKNETDVVQLSSNNCESKNIAVIKSDGTVKVFGEKTYGQCRTEDWSNVVFVYTGEKSTIGIDKNGKILVTGRFQDGDYYSSITDWTGLKRYKEWRNM